MKVPRVDVEPRVSHRATLPEQLVEQILLRVSPDEPAHLIRATVVCKSWHSILSDDTFRRRYGMFNGKPPLQGYFCNHGDNDWTCTVRFVPTTSVATTQVHHCTSDRTISAVDCRHGRVLCKAKDNTYFSADGLIVWDPITGGQQDLRMPSYSNYPQHLHVGAVLCAKDGCDHLDCHAGPFLVVVVGSSRVGSNDVVSTWAGVYSSETGTWSAPTPQITYQCLDDKRPSLLIGDAVYFTIKDRTVIKYDFRKHELSMIGCPEGFWPMLIKGDDGGLGVAAMFLSGIHIWSWRAGINGTERWVKSRVVELDKQISKGGWPRGLICTVEDTNIICIYIDAGIFMINLNSGQVIRKIGQKDHSQWPILPYMSFDAPKY